MRRVLGGIVLVLLFLAAARIDYLTMLDTGLLP